MGVRTNRASLYSEIVADSIPQNNTHEFEDMKLGDMNNTNPTQIRGW